MGQSRTFYLRSENRTSRPQRGIFWIFFFVALALAPLSGRAQQSEKVQPLRASSQIERPQPTSAVRNGVLDKPRAFVHEIGATGKDLATFQNPQWSFLTVAQIGAATADAVTSLNVLRACAVCTETGPSRFFVGQHPDAHKYVTAGIFEIGAEAVLAHYMQHHGPVHKWYWRALWTLPQSLSLYEHVRASEHNAALLP